MENTESIREILNRSGKYTSLTSGYSMWPLLHHQRDNIIVIKNKDRLQKYDIALYEAKNGKYIMHRVIEVHPDHYIIKGDNCVTNEYVTDGMVCGVLAGFYKNGKRYIDCLNGRGQKLYARIWIALSPLRPVLFSAERLAGKIKRKMKKDR